MVLVTAWDMVRCDRCGVYCGRSTEGTRWCRLPTAPHNVNLHHKTAPPARRTTTTTTGTKVLWWPPLSARPPVTMHSSPGTTLYSLSTHGHPVDTPRQAPPSRRYHSSIWG